VRAWGGTQEQQQLDCCASFFNNYFKFVIFKENFNLLNMCFVLDATVFCAQ
jgi:hypothetical protein